MARLSRIRDLTLTPALSLGRERGEDGSTTLEWALLLAAFALPSYFILKTLLGILLAYYEMMATLNSLPFP